MKMNLRTLIINLVIVVCVALAGIGFSTPTGMQLAHRINSAAHVLNTCHVQAISAEVFHAV